MIPPRSMLRFLLIALLCVGAASGAESRDGDFQVIVHPDNRVDALSRDFVRDLYLKKVVEWSGGQTARPIDLSSRFPPRDRFTHDVIRKTPAQLKSYWNQQVFSGKGVPPPEADAPADVVAYVLANPGAIGYLPANVDPGRAKVVRVQ